MWTSSVRTPRGSTAGGGDAARLPSLRRWTALCAAAETVGMTAAAAAAKAAAALVEDDPGAAALAGGLALVVAGGLVEGTALGVAQAAGLRELLTPRRRRLWVLVTVAVAGLGWAAASAPAALSGDESGTTPPLLLVLAGAAGLGAVMGAALGAAQGAVLRAVVPRPWRWVAVSAAAWTPAMVVVFLGATTPSADWSVATVVLLGALTGLAAGTVLGLVSGRLLPSLLHGRAGAGTA